MMISNFIKSYLSEIIAFLAFAATSWQAWLAWRHNILSVRPVIDSWLDTSESTLHFWIQNKGLGSAEIVSFDMKLRGLKLTPESLKKALLDFRCDIKFTVYTSELNKREVSFLARDEKVDLVKIKFEDLKLIEESELYDFLEKNFSLYIKYKSMYGKVFKYRINAQEV